MPIEYKLEKNGAIVTAHASGVITLDCFMSMQQEMRADDNLKTKHNTLLDVRDVSQIEMTEDDLSTIAKGLTSDPKKLGANKLAIVANKNQAFQLGKKYQTVEKGVEETVIVFNSISTARKWVGLD